jgi:hypothetical protein
MSEKLKRIKSAYDQAQKFIERCDTLFECLHKHEGGIDEAQSRYLESTSKESGAVTSASMRLTRALYVMRKP